MPEQPEARAGGLLDSLKKAFNLGSKKAAPEAAAAETPVEAPVAPASELPDWLNAPVAEVPLPVAPTTEATETIRVEDITKPIVVSGAEEMKSEPASAETDPFKVNKEFNGYMETIRQAQAVLASGIGLTPEEQKKALIAVARSNSLLPKLPPEVLESVLLMRAVASGNPKFGRDDFQREILAAMNVIKTGTAVKG